MTGKAIDMTRRNLLAASAGLGAGMVGAAVASPARGAMIDTDARILDLWNKRADLAEKVWAANAACTDAAYRMPWWAQEGPRSIDQDGQPCGSLSYWPADPELCKLPFPSRGCHRMVRLDPRLVEWMHTEKARRSVRSADEWRAKRLARLDELQAMQNEERRKVNLHRLDSEADALVSHYVDVLEALDEAFDAAESISPVVASAVFMLTMANTLKADDSFMIFETACEPLHSLLRLSLPALSGALEEEAADLLAHAGRPVGELLFYRRRV